LIPICSTSLRRSNAEVKAAVHRLGDGRRFTSAGRHGLRLAESPDAS